MLIIICEFKETVYGCIKVDDKRKRNGKETKSSYYEGKLIRKKRND